MRTSKEIREERQRRLFKVLDYDPTLSLFQIQERFGITNSAASTLRKKWRDSKGIK